MRELLTNGSMALCDIFHVIVMINLKMFFYELDSKLTSLTMGEPLMAGFVAFSYIYTVKVIMDNHF